MFNSDAVVMSDAVRVAGMALAMAVGGVVAAPADSAQIDEAAGQGCAVIAPEVGAEPWVRTELFFGASKPDGTEISESEWQAFLDAEITPRFPDGLTVLDAAGQWQGDNDEIVQERSKVVILLYPREAIAESNTEIEDIRVAYERAFQQESVLRADDDRPVCTSF